MRFQGWGVNEEVEQEPINEGCARKDICGSQLISVDGCIE